MYRNLNNVKKIWLVIEYINKYKKEYFVVYQESTDHIAKRNE